MALATDALAGPGANGAGVTCAGPEVRIALAHFNNMVLRTQAYARPSLATMLAIVLFRLFPLQLDAEYVDGGSRLIFSVDSAGNVGGFVLYVLTCGWLVWALSWPSSTRGPRVKATLPIPPLNRHLRSLHLAAAAVLLMLMAVLSSTEARARAALETPLRWDDHVRAVEHKLAPLFPDCVEVGSAPVLRGAAGAGNLANIASLAPLYADLDLAAKHFPWRRGMAAAPSTVPWRRPAQVGRHKWRHDLSGRSCLGAPRVPIIVIVKDRLTVLRETLRSLHEFLHTPFEIVVHDQGTTHPPTCAFLRELERSGVRVFRRSADTIRAARSPTGEMWKSTSENERQISREHEYVNATIETVLRDSASPYYVVTDPDIALYDSPNGDALFVYATLLEATGKLAIGPALRTDDTGPSAAVAPGANENWLWPARAELFSFRGLPHYFARDSVVDTTFALRKAGTKFARLQPASRVMPPYSARHLDWYVQPSSPPADALFYHCKLRAMAEEAQKSRSARLAGIAVISHSAKRIDSDANWQQCAALLAAARSCGKPTPYA